MEHKRYPIYPLLTTSKQVFRKWVIAMSESFFEKLCCEIGSMNAGEVRDRILHFKGKIKLDFTEDYLNGLSVDRLRHILLAALMTDSRKTA